MEATVCVLCFVDKSKPEAQLLLHTLQSVPLSFNKLRRVKIKTYRCWVFYGPLVVFFRVAIVKADYLWGYK